MERILLYHPHFPHTEDHPISRLASKAEQYYEKGWRDFPPSDGEWEESTDEQPVSTLDEGEEK